MKKQIIKIASGAFRFPSPFNAIKETLNDHVKDADYSAKELLDDYAELFTIYHNREVRRKLRSINRIMVFFAVLLILSIIIFLFSEIGFSEIGSAL